jgi:hypothetical protein
VRIWLGLAKHAEDQNTMARTTLTKEAFEDRLASLQLKMKNQLNEQLKRMEEKMCAPKIKMLPKLRKLSHN